LEGHGGRVAAFGHQRVDGVELRLALRVELAGRAVGVQPIDARRDEGIDFTRQPAIVDAVVVVDRQHERGPVAAQLIGAEGHHAVAPPLPPRDTRRVSALTWAAISARASARIAGVGVPRRMASSTIVSAATNSSPMSATSAAISTGMVLTPLRSACSRSSGKMVNPPTRTGTCTCGMWL